MYKTVRNVVEATIFHLLLDEDIGKSRFLSFIVLRISQWCYFSIDAGGLFQEESQRRHLGFLLLEKRGVMCLFDLLVQPFG